MKFSISKQFNLITLIWFYETISKTLIIDRQIKLKTYLLIDMLRKKVWPQSLI